MQALNTNPFWMTTGCSFGAYHAVNFALRYPQLIKRTIGLSGIYDIRGWLDGYYDDNVYFNNPVDYTANLHDPSQIGLLKQQDIIFATGADDANRWSNDLLSTNLWRTGVGATLPQRVGWGAPSSALQTNIPTHIGVTTW